MHKTMRVPIFKGAGVLAFEERAIPHITDVHDIIVAVDACGICGTDLNILAVPAAHVAEIGTIIGHEVVGVVQQVGSAVVDLQIGDRIVVAPRLVCNTCYYCQSGLHNQCNNYTTIGITEDGGFAPYIRLPSSAAHKIADVPVQDAVFFEPLSCVVGAVARPPFLPGNSVLIIGAGPMGLLFALVYRMLGAGKIAVLDRADARLQFCKKLDIDIIVDARRQESIAQLQKELPMGCNIVVDAVGNQLGNALTYAHRGGHIVAFGLRAHDTVSVSQYQLTRYDVTVHGVFVGLHPFIPTIRLLESKRIQPSQLITHTLGLHDLQKGVALMRNAEAMKVIIDPNISLK